MTKLDTGAPLHLVTGDTDKTNHPRDDYESNFAEINTDAQARRDAEAALAASISSESAALATETTNRTNADTTLQGHVDSEATTRASADTALAASVSTEATARSGADTTLQFHIDSEAATRARQPIQHFRRTSRPRQPLVSL